MRPNGARGSFLRRAVAAIQADVSFALSGFVGEQFGEARMRAADVAGRDALGSFCHHSRDYALPESLGDWHLYLCGDCVFPAVSSMEQYRSACARGELYV